MKYQLKVIFKKILNNIDLIKKFINLKPEKIYKFSKEIYLSEDISKHLEFINEEEFWQEIFSMITGKEIHKLEDLERVAGGRISLKKGFTPTLLSFLTVGGHLLPGSDYILSPVANAVKFRVPVDSVEIDEPQTSLAVIHTINRSPILKTMFGFAEKTQVTKLEEENIQAYQEHLESPAKCDMAASTLLTVLHALPLIAKKFSTGNDLNMDGLFKMLKDDKGHYSLLELIGKLKSDVTNGGTKTLGKTVFSFLPGKNWNKYTASREEDLARVQLLIAYYEDYVFKTNATTFGLDDSLRDSVDAFFGKFYVDHQCTKWLTASNYADSILSQYIGKLKTLDQDAATDLLNAFKQEFPILNTVSDTFDKVKGIASDIGTLTSAKNPQGIPAVVKKVRDIISKLIDWRYSPQKLKEIKTLLEKIASSSDPSDILEKLRELERITGTRTESLPETPVQQEINSRILKLCNYISLIAAAKQKGSLPETGAIPPDQHLLMTEVKKDATELKIFIEETESSKSDLEKLLSNGQGLIGDVQEKLKELNDRGFLSAVGLQNEYEALKKEVFDKFNELKNEAFGKIDEIWNELKSEEGLLGKGTQIAENVKKITGVVSEKSEDLKEVIGDVKNITGAVSDKSEDIKEIIDDVKKITGQVEQKTEDLKEIIGDVKKVTGFLSNPRLAAGVLGAGGAALLGTTGIFSKVFKGIFHEATSVFGGVRKFYNEKIYNNLFLEKDPMKLKKLVSEYLKSTLMFPGQASDKVAEVLSANKLSGQVPAMLELSGNVCSEVFSEIHRSMFERNFETWQKIDVAQQKPQVISRTISDDSKEKITLSLADTIFNTTNSSMRKLKNNTGTTLVFENLADQSVIDRLEEARKTGVLSLYNNTTGEHEELDVSKTVILISNKRKDNKVILENSEHIKFEDFTEEEYAYILADKLSEKREKYYKQYKNTVEFSDDFIENISKKAVKDHAGYNDAEKYIKNIDSALLSFLSQNIETNNLQLECYIDENDQFMFKEQEIIIENQEEPEQEIETENEQNLEEIEIT